MKDGMRLPTPCILLGTVLLCLSAAPISAQSSTEATGTTASGTLSPEEEKAADMRMPDLDRSGMLPELRQPETVTDAMRNPFGGAAKVFDQITGPSEGDERTRLRRLLNNLRISGVATSPQGMRVLVGSVSLGKGDELPPFFHNQGERLLVESVSDRSVLLRFVTNEEAKKQQPIALSFDLRPPTPQKSSLRLGEAFNKLIPVDDEGSVALKPLESAPAQAILQNAKDQGLQSLVDRPTELFNAPAIPPPNEAAQP